MRMNYSLFRVAIVWHSITRQKHSIESFNSKMDQMIRWTYILCVCTETYTLYRLTEIQFAFNMKLLTKIKT